jgi:hypothetical protein
MHQESTTIIKDFSNGGAWYTPLWSTIDSDFQKPTCLCIKRSMGTNELCGATSTTILHYSTTVIKPRLSHFLWLSANLWWDDEILGEERGRRVGRWAAKWGQVPPVDDSRRYHHRWCWAGAFCPRFLLFVHLKPSNCLIRN